MTCTPLTLPLKPPTTRLLPSVIRLYFLKSTPTVPTILLRHMMPLRHLPRHTLLDSGPCLPLFLKPHRKLPLPLLLKFLTRSNRSSAASLALRPALLKRPVPQPYLRQSQHPWLKVFLSRSVPSFVRRLITAEKRGRFRVHLLTRKWRCLSSMRFKFVEVRCVILVIDGRYRQLQGLKRSTELRKECPAGASEAEVTELPLKL
jgi:hypothetical protein